jgi:hypothetical protein
MRSSPLVEADLRCHILAGWYGREVDAEISMPSIRLHSCHVWVLLSWKENLDPAEMERRGKEFLGQ